MAISRNQRRKFARQKQLARAANVQKALEIKGALERNAIVKANLSTPLPSKFVDGRGLYRSCMANLAGESHRGYVCSNSKRIVFNSKDDKGHWR